MNFKTSIITKLGILVSSLFLVGCAAANKYTSEYATQQAPVEPVKEMAQIRLESLENVTIAPAINNRLSGSHAEYSFDENGRVAIVLSTS